MRSRSWLVAVFVVIAVQMSPVLENISAQAGPGIVISELRFSGPRGDNDEFIELFNASEADINIGLWEVRVSGADSTSNAARFRIPTNARVRAGCYYLMTFTPNTAIAPGYTGSVRGDVTYGVGFPDTGGVAIGPPSAALVDRVGFSPRTLYFEGTPITGGYSTVNRSFERVPGGGNGLVDTNDNAADFQLITPSNPQSSASPCGTSVKPHDVQGNGPTSRMVGAVRTVQGVITARAHTGFFIQTEFGEEDTDANTSEGLFVYTGVGVTVPAAAQVGHVVKVTGAVEEFVPASDPGSASRTRLRLYSMTEVGTGPMPDAYVLEPADLSDVGSLDRLERLEGMRVTALSLTAVSRTTADGVFYTVLTEQFNDNGSNPELLRVDSDGIEGIDAVDVSSGAVMSNVTGPLDFESRTYTLFPDAALAPFFPPDVDAPVIDPAADVAAVEATGPDGAAVDFPTPGATDNRDDVVTVTCTPASGSVFGLGNSTVTCSAFDQAGNAAADVGFTVIVQDTTAPVITVPDDISEEATSPAGRVVTYNATAHDAVSGSFVASCSSASGHTFPIGTTGVTCSAIDVAGNEAEDVGFTVKVQDTTAPVITVPDDISEEATSPAGRVVTYNATADDAVSGSLVVTCLPVSGSLFPLDNTRVTCSASDVAGNLAQASFTVTVADTTAPVFNPTTEAGTAEAAGPYGAAVHFPTPTATDTVDDVVTVTCTPASGSVFGLGNSAVTCSASDRAGNRAAVSFMVTVADTTAPAMTGPDDIRAEATSPAGREVTYHATARDAVSGSLAALCSPVSGSTFPIGTTGVTCSASDAARNSAQVLFNVTVQDTTAPAMTVPDDISGQATSPAGRVVTYNAMAYDAVSGYFVASCLPASGSTFPIGTTDVDCTASDKTGNMSEAHFSVSISQALQGRMHGAGSVGSGQQRVSFTFDAGESANQVDRGWLMMLVKDGAGRPRSFAGKVDNVSFSNAEGYTPGQMPASGVDTVMFSGVGTWNGRSGYSFRVTASDRGEPGVNHDTFTIEVTVTTTGYVVESTSGVLRGGNIQSLR